MYGQTLHRDYCPLSLIQVGLHYALMELEICVKFNVSWEMCNEPSHQYTIQVHFLLLQQLVCVSIFNWDAILFSFSIILLSKKGS